MLSFVEKNQNCTKGEPEKLYAEAPDYEDVAARLELQVPKKLKKPKEPWKLRKPKQPRKWAIRYANATSHQELCVLTTLRMSKNAQSVVTRSPLSMVVPGEKDALFNFISL